MSKKDITVNLVIVVTGGAGTCLAIFYGYDPLNVLLGIASFYIMSVVGVCLHELGHACGALSAGGVIHSIHFGQRYQKWKPWKFRFLGTWWQINSAPISGMVFCSFGTPLYYRLRYCWMVACGPLVNLLLLVIGLLIIAFDQYPSVLPYLIGSCSANAYLLAISAIPRPVQINGQIRANDGLIFLQTLRYTDEDIAHAIQLGEVTCELEREAPGIEGLEPSELIARHQADPSNLSILRHLANQLFETNDSLYVPYVLALIEHPKMPDRSLVQVIDMYLTWQLHTGIPEDPERADQLSQRLLSLQDTLSTRGTRGSILVDIGQRDKGKAMLQEVLEKTEATIDKAYSHTFLALAAKAEGDRDLARAHALKARKADATCPALKRISNLLP